MKLPESPPDINDIIKHADKEDLINALSSNDFGFAEYLHWSQFKYKKMPSGITPEFGWLKTKLNRKAQYIKIPMLIDGGGNFNYCLTNKIQEACHIIDSKPHDSMLLETNNKNVEKDYYVFMSLVEEAFSSSLIEGAVSTRHDAINMIHKGKEPKNKSEKMILNNYFAMHSLQDICCEQLSIELIKDLHSKITSGTLDNEAMEGEFQSSSEERIAVYDNVSNRKLYQPPPALEIEKRLQGLITFSNVENDSQFIHPVIKAIITHFWLAYIHPFEDGNGRLARSLFYKQMLCSGYWLFEYISISSVIYDSQAKYYRAFLYTESDDNDLTYFIHHQLDCILKAIDSVEKYIQKKINLIKDIENRIKNKDLNYRQLALISNALRHPTEIYSIKSHMTIHNVSYGTARNDLFELWDIDVLQEGIKISNERTWETPQNFEEILNEL